MEDEWEEEEQLVVVELSGIINSDFLTQCDCKCKILGMDSEQPMMQVGRYVFAGEYEDGLGTCVIFQEEPGHDTESGGTPELKYMCHTAKKLMMQRTFLSEKKEGEASSGGIEVLQLNDREFTGRNNTICNFLHEPNETGGESRDEGDRDSGAGPDPSSGSEASDSEQAELSRDPAGPPFSQRDPEDGMDTLDNSVAGKT
ncbi:general transcription factor 3C polypeptide 6 [Scleropages formosus]|uniref:general transcription factor 3C polypeptide 6 n=1 Tax=Scleropages formosus TaxID=113540 RepID=UPI0008781668|nr:general transcription factor 3C polypeptide 6 [Scleropages formosus]